MTLRKTPAHCNQHLLPPPDARECHLEASSVAKLAPAGLCPRPEARPTGRAGDKCDPGCQRVSDHRLVMSKIRGPQRMEELLLRDQSCLRSTNQNVSADGPTLLTEKKQILQRWAEHYQGVLNRPSTISGSAIVPLPLVETNVDLNLPPSLYETIRAVQQFSGRKRPDRTRSRLRSTSTMASNSWII
nr:unnamed protein product [Spirometra erinaceieuropaei]